MASEKANIPEQKNPENVPIYPTSFSLEELREAIQKDRKIYDEITKAT